MNDPKSDLNDVVVPEDQGVGGALKREISGLGYAAMTLNGVIGAGIFGLPAVAAARAGEFSPWMFLICGALTLTIVLSFAAAASTVRETGGVILYAERAFGRFAGFQTGWLSYLARVASLAANTNLLVTYLAWFWAPLDINPWRGIALTVIIIGLSAINARGARNSVIAIYAFTIMKLLPLSLLVLFGMGQVDLASLFGSSAPELSTFGETILVLLYAFVGFEGTVVNAGEGKRPRKDIPRALVHTILIITGFYFLIQWVAVATLPGLAESRTALSDVATVLFGAIGAGVLTLGAVFSITGNTMTAMLSAPRMTWTMGRDGLLPKWFARVHPNHRTPHTSIWFYGLLGLALALTGSFVWLAMMSTLVRLLAYMITIVALPRLKQQAEMPELIYRLPLGYAIPLLALGLCFWLIVQAPLDAWGVLIGFAVTGTVFYVLTAGKSKVG